MLRPKRKLSHKDRATMYRELVQQSVDILDSLDVLLPKVQPIDSEDEPSLEIAKIRLIFFLALVKKAMKEIEAT